MIGAIIGDVAGSRFERANHKSKEFEMFDKRCRPTDDSIMSLAVAKALLEYEDGVDDLSTKAVSSMQELGRIYKNAGYGGTFIKWIFADDPQPYNSFGNGAGMRVGPCGFAAKTIEEAKELSALVTKVTHDHPEGMKGAEAISVAVFLSRNGKSKEEIKAYVKENYYNIEFTLDQIRKDYKFDVTCQGSVPVALEAFFESGDFEDAIRNAISVGGDSDTIAAMTGVVAEAYYGIPEGMIETAIDYLDSREMEILYYFEKAYPSKALDEDGEASRSIFDVIDDCVDKIIPAGTTVEVDGELPGGAIHARVDSDVMKPDFSSFDKPDHAKEAKDFITKAGTDLSKTAKKAGKGIFAVAKSVKDNVDKSKEKAAAKAIRCYAIAVDNSEDTEKTMHAVSIYQKAGYEAKVHVSAGTMFGYVFLKMEELDKAVALLEGVEGVSLNPNPVDKIMAEMIRKH